jgi:hypothetical protein
MPGLSVHSSLQALDVIKWSTDEIKRLRALVESAYLDGLDEGLQWDEDEWCPKHSELWERSESAKGLVIPQPKDVR